MDKKILAVNGGKPVLESEPEDMFHWPIVTAEDEEAVCAVLRAGKMSGTDITRQFEKEYAAWTGAKYALATCNGTAALQEALWACGVCGGREVIAPSMTYWASCACIITLGAEINFADIQADTLCIDPDDIEHRINERTAAIMVVHYGGYPADMDRINAIARRHGIKVIEDVSHAQGALYKGRMCGTLGDISATSMMGAKAFAVGEGGMVLTDSRELYEKCMLFGHYERLGASRYSSNVEHLEALPEYAPYIGVPMGGVKHRMNQTCSAMGRVQLKYYPERMAEIQKSMNYFWDGLADLKGLHAHRNQNPGCTMGGWYRPRGLFRSEELDGLDCERFCEAIRAEGIHMGSGANAPLHLHPYFTQADPLHIGRKPLKQDELPVSSAIAGTTCSTPWFKHFRPEIIDRYIEAYRKVLTHYQELL